MDKRLLINRNFNINGGWYGPESFLNWNFKSVICSHLINTCDTSGNWDGMFVQKLGKKYYLINFNQTKNYKTNFTLHTGDVVKIMDEHPTYEDLEYAHEIYYSRMVD